MTKRLAVLRWSAAVALAALALAALAQGTVPDPSDGGAFIQAILDAIASGQWKVVAILIAVAVVYALRQVATRLPGAVGLFFQSARGGALTALLGGVVTAVAGLVVGGGPITVGVFINGVVLGIMAAGGWTIIRRLIWGDAAPAAYKAPPA
jgi:uncharacterized protein GlcG (DUF336 family)